MWKSILRYRNPFLLRPHTLIQTLSTPILLMSLHLSLLKVEGQGWRILTQRLCFKPWTILTLLEMMSPPSRETDQGESISRTFPRKVMTLVREVVRRAREDPLLSIQDLVSNSLRATLSLATLRSYWTLNERVLPVDSSFLHKVFFILQGICLRTFKARRVSLGSILGVPLVQRRNHQRSHLFLLLIAAPATWSRQWARRTSLDCQSTRLLKSMIRPSSR